MREIDFQEVSATAAQEASLALGKLAGQPVAVRMTQVHVIHGPKDHRSLPHDQAVVGVQMPITGDLEGGALLCFPKADAQSLGSRLAGKASAPGRGMEDSALKEVGNIICGRYLTVLSNALKEKVLPGLPALERGKFGPLSEKTISGLAREFGSAWFLQVEVVLADTSTVGDLLIFFRTGGPPA